MILQTLVQVHWEPGPTEIVPNWAPHKGRGMCYSVCEFMHIKEPLLQIGNNS